MNSQNTPVHIKLWHKEFWFLAIANMFLSMSVYMLVPVLPVWLINEQNFTAMETGLSMGVFALGLFTFGVFCTYLVQHFRRNRVCLWSIAALALSVGMLWYANSLRSVFVEFWVVLLIRLLQGATFGLAQMVLTSTLIIDTTESYQRTEANHSAAWFARFALSLGPMISLLMYRWWGFEGVTIAVGISAALAFILINAVKFPFRAPEDTVTLVSLDRFFLPQGKWLFINFTLVVMVIGMLFSMRLHEHFYAMLMVGFLIALLAQRFVFRDAELKSEVVSGLIMIGAALFAMLTDREEVMGFIVPCLIGFGIGIISSRFLLFFIKLSRHCQRGTSQSTYMLAWEAGLSIGLCLGYSVFYTHTRQMVIACIGLVALSLAMYHLFTHRWFICHKNR